MDINQTMKINNLVNEFKKQGVSTDQALEQATKLINGKESASQIEEVNQSTLNIINRKIAYLSELNERRIKEEVEKSKSEIKTLVIEIETIKRALNDLTSTIKTIQQQKPQEQQTKIETKTSKETKPRTGDFQPGDIDLKDIFYCGPKK